eukprot:s1299_g6.t2
MGQAVPDPSICGKLGVLLRLGTIIPLIAKPSTASVLCVDVERPSSWHEEASELCAVPDLPNPFTVTTDCPVLVAEMLKNIPSEDWDAKRFIEPVPIAGLPNLFHGPGGLLSPHTPRQLANNQLAAAIANRLCENLRISLARACQDYALKQMQILRSACPACTSGQNSKAMKTLMKRSSLAVPSPLGSPLEPGTLVWVKDKDGGQVWVKAEVLSIDGSNVQVRTDDGEVFMLTSADKILRCNEDTWKSKEGLTGVNDLSSLTHLHEPEVLQALHLRFDVDQIYTFCGPILIALNPFKDIPGLYASVNDKKFQDLSKPPPHIYAVASRAFHGLSNAKQSQVVLISGESGAGKTETTKHVLKFLTSQLSENKSKEKGKTSQVGKTPSVHSGTEKKVLSSNPILEAFGNACTVRNNNSSRFGKFIELRFQAGGGHGPSFSNAAIETYLLEKVRVTKIDKQERSYHIFYQACAAAANLDPQDLEGLPMDYFRSAQDFRYLVQSDRFELDGVDDAEEFQIMRKSMEAMDIPPQEQADIFRITAAVLHIGNLTIVEKVAGKFEVDQNNPSFKAVSEIMGIQPAALARALTHKLIAVGSERYDSPLEREQCEARRESFARMIYSYLFNHMVYRINESLSSGRTGSTTSKLSFIGVLDIFGFEHFKVNSFEQLCINFANERLQQMFNHFVFEVEMELYKQEGITCDFSDFPDNQGIIDLIQAKSMSVFTLLDEECRMPKGADKSFVQKLWKQFEKNENFKIEPRKPMNFTIIHFAGPVSYDASNFMDKNMDELGELLKQAIEGSSSQFVRSLLERTVTADAKSPSQPAPRGAGGRAKTLKPHTVATDFKSQLESLVGKMKVAGPHFVRCVKPNPEKLPDRLERLLVVEQLRSGGVIEALHVQRAGYPCRSLHKSCWKEFLSIIFKSEERERFGKLPLDACLKESLAQLSKELKWPASMPLYAIGKTTVFFKQVAYETIEGSLGNCWLIGALACVADFPGHVEMLLEPSTLSADGRYVVQLYHTESGWRAIEIDDLVPCFSSPFWAGPGTFLAGDKPCFSQPVEGEVWSLLLEKAFAKLAGSYGALEGGVPELAFQALTGQREQLRWQREGAQWRKLRFKTPIWSKSHVKGAALEITNRTLPLEQFFLRLAYYEQANFLLAASISKGGMTERRREDGLIEGHAYSVLEVQEVHGLRFIRLRNPWGKEEWKGRWSRGSDAWKLHSHVAQDICQRGGHRLDRGQQDGSFWILFDDFAACFDSVNVCPATMPVPKASRYAKSKKRSHAPVCGRCGQPVESCWLLVRGHGTEPISAAGAPAGLGWVRLADGDLCQLCLRATSSQRRAFWQGAPSAGAESGGMAGIREVELTRRVPGIDYFPFEAGAGCSPPLKRPHCMRMAMLGNSAKKIQRAWRVYIFRTIFVMIRSKAILVQAVVRRYLARVHLWNRMKPGQRKRSRLFRAYIAAHPGAATEDGEVDSEDEREAEAERQRLEKLRVSREEQERQRREQEQREKEEQERLQREEEEERRRLEEEKIRLAKEAEERRLEEERQKLEQAKLAAAEEERKRAEDLRQEAEKAWLEEKAAIQKQHNEELRQLRSQLTSAKDAEEQLQTQHEVEVAKFKQDAETQGADLQRQASEFQRSEAQLKGKREPDVVASKL